MGKKAILVLDNGSIYEGKSCGVEGERVGLVTFYTGVVGYQEVITSPSNAGKIIVMTYPLIGNYGVAKKFWESWKCWTEGLIIKEKSRITSNWQAEGDFDKFLEKAKVLAMEGIDTRSLMIELRESGERLGIISNRDFNLKSLKKKIEAKKNKDLDVIGKISVKKVTEFANHGLMVAVIDIGITDSLISQFKRLGCHVILLPHKIKYDEVLKLSPKGLIISDGPEMDKGLYVVIDTVKRLLGKLPILGLGTGCQVLAMAMGARINRMFLGHHGLNYPVLRPGSLKGDITVQNHSYVIDENSLNGKNIDITSRNINDQTIEGIECKKLGVSGFQFYPASPGMGEVNPVIEEFIGLIKRS